MMHADQNQFPIQISPDEQRKNARGEKNTDSIVSRARGGW